MGDVPTSWDSPCNRKSCHACALPKESDTRDDTECAIQPDDERMADSGDSNRPIGGTELHDCMIATTTRTGGFTGSCARMVSAPPVTSPGAPCRSARRALDFRAPKAERPDPGEEQP